MLVVVVAAGFLLEAAEPPGTSPAPPPRGSEHRAIPEGAHLWNTESITPRPLPGPGNPYGSPTDDPAHRYLPHRWVKYPHHLFTGEERERSRRQAAHPGSHSDVGLKLRQPDSTTMFLIYSTVFLLRLSLICRVIPTPRKPSSSQGGSWSDSRGGRGRSE